MIYGDGDGVRWRPLALALDVVGHELTHAVTSRTARFVYAEEAGALDESFADFFGVMVTNEDPVSDWEMGEGVFTPFRSGDALRDLSDPPKYNQPDHMDDFIHLASGEQPDPDKNDNGWVHANSGIPNKVGYLIVDGGTHHGIRVEGIGRAKAEQIFYLALTVYLSSSTMSRWTFMQARYALLNGCRQLYGDTGQEYATVKNAWAAVGVGEPTEDFTVVEKTVSPDTPIPDLDAVGIRSAIQVTEQGLLKDIQVSVNIEHSYRGDLRVTLISPSNESVVLHDRKGRSKENIVKTYGLKKRPQLQAFVGDQIQGDWVLHVADHAKDDTGKLLSWGVKLSVEETERKTLRKEAAPGLLVPDEDTSGIESGIQVGESGKIVNLDVSVKITHTWIGDLKVILSAPSGDEVILHDLKGHSRQGIEKVYSTKLDERLQVLIGKDIQGEWRLKVADHIGEDTGTLDEWALDFVYE
jgi:subtilisin-like proprotein convertase family protein